MSFYFSKLFSYHSTVSFTGVTKHLWSYRQISEKPHNPRYAMITAALSEAGRVSYVALNNLDVFPTWKGNKTSYLNTSSERLVVWEAGVYLTETTLGQSVRTLGARKSYLICMFLINYIGFHLHILCWGRFRCWVRPTKILIRGIELSCVWGDCIL